MTTWFPSFFSALKTYDVKVVICKSISVLLGIFKKTHIKSRIYKTDRSPPHPAALQDGSSGCIWAPRVLHTDDEVVGPPAAMDPGQDIYLLHVVTPGFQELNLFLCELTWKPFPNIYTFREFRTLAQESDGQTWVLVLDALLRSCMTLGKLLYYSEPQSHHV